MVQVPDNKLYFRMGEASRIVGVEPYVLRYWESEFPQIKPARADSKQRTYKRDDLLLLLEIKQLLYEEKMTIKGARQRLGIKRAKQGPGQQKDIKIKVDLRFLESIKTELREILKILT